MEQRVLDKTVERSLVAAIRATSDGRFWTGIEARSYDVFGGRTELGVTQAHTLAMLAGAPIPSSCRCEGLLSQRLQIPGDVDIIPAGAHTVWEFNGVAAFVEVRLSPALVRSAADEMGLNAARCALEPQLGIRDPKIEHVLWALKAELEGDAPQGRMYAESLGMALAAHLLRRYLPPDRPTEGGLSQRRLQRVLDYIRENIAQDLSLAELAGVAEVSTSHFKLLFRKSVGMPAHQYVIRTRVEHATELLLGERLPLCEVALLAGFANQSHLTRCMRRMTGRTPSELLRHVGSSRTATAAS
ncbi:MAG: helix-turn-helix domain-containing protein [Vulcanimicrobiaceae bacterium]